jgi:hypothetical protein
VFINHYAISVHKAHVTVYLECVNDIHVHETAGNDMHVSLCS